MKVNPLILLVLSLFLFFSCNSDDDAVSIEDRNAALYGQWEYEAIMSDTAVDINGDGTVNIDLCNTNDIRQCLKDDIMFFSARDEGEKNVYTINENGLSCGEVPAFNNLGEDRYELINNEILRFDNRNDMRIVEFKQNRLVLEQDDFQDGQNIVITYTYKRS
ncbi:hypothetical protein [Pseudozobellia sp. WGM2]|uniref:hypothetical protein n=1 Tax=Pseudozobellia sp. WGM2 TaxID=2787625 RepID=UPI001ADEE8DF|nr:hypothetical protein [Pseudozobellia sp. WGM2]